MESNTGKSSYKPKGNLLSRYTTSLAPVTEKYSDVATDASTSDLTSACLDSKGDSQPTSNLTEEVIQQTSMDTSTDATPASSEIKESIMETDVGTTTTDTATIAYSKPIKEWTKAMSTQIQKMLRIERRKRPGTKDIPEEDPLPEIKIEKKHMLKSALMEASSRVKTLFAPSQAKLVRSEADKMPTRKWIEDLIVEIDNATEDVVLIVATSKDRPSKLRKKKSKPRRSRTKTQPKATTSHHLTSSETTSLSTLSNTLASTLANISADTLITTFANIPVTTSTIYSVITPVTTSVTLETTPVCSPFATTSAGTLATTSAIFPVTTSVYSPFLAPTSASTSMSTLKDRSPSALATAFTSALTTSAGSLETNFATTSAGYPVYSHFLEMTSASTSITTSMSAIASSASFPKTTSASTATCTFITTPAITSQTAADMDFVFDCQGFHIPYTKHYPWTYSENWKENRPFPLPIATDTLKEVDSEVTNYTPKFEIEPPSLRTESTPMSTSNVDTLSEEKILKNVHSKDYSYKQPRKKFKGMGPVDTKVKTCASASTLTSAFGSISATSSVSTPTISESTLRIPTTNVNTVFENTNLEVAHSKDTSSKHSKKKLKRQNPSSMDSNVTAVVPSLTEMKPPTISKRIPSSTTPNIDKDEHTDGDSKDSSRSHGKKKWKHQRARSLKEILSEVTFACATPSPSGSLATTSASSFETTSSSSPAPLPSSSSLLCLESIFAAAAATSSPESTSTRKKSKKLRAKQPVVYDDIKEKECFIPKGKERLIYLMLNSEVNIENLVYEWEYLCRQREFMGLLYMLQFITDLAGFSEFDFLHHYLVTDMRIELIIPQMERCVPDFMKEHGFLLNAKSNWSKQAQKTVYEFVKGLVKAIERHFLVSNSDVLCEMFRLLDFMSASKQPAIKFTGIALALKFGVGIANYLHTARPELAILKVEKTRKLDSKIILLEKKIIYAMNLLKYLGFITVSNCVDLNL